MRKKFIDAFNQKLFQDLIPEEEVKSEQGFFTNVVANLQVKVKNLHVRFESNNPYFSNDFFSLGATLEKLEIHTTNEDFEIMYMDRKAQKPLYKILKIKNLGLYCKPKDKFISGPGMGNKEQRIRQLSQLFSFGQNKII